MERVCTLSMMTPYTFGVSDSLGVYGACYLVGLCYGLFCKGLILMVTRQVMGVLQWFSVIGRFIEFVLDCLC